MSKGHLAYLALGGQWVSAMLALVNNMNGTGQHFISFDDLLFITRQDHPLIQFLLHAGLPLALFQRTLNLYAL